MAFQKTPSYLYRKAPGSLFYLKLPIPPALRHHFPDAKGKPRTHVVEALGTAKDTEAEQSKRPRLAYYWAAFKRLQAADAAPAAPTDLGRLLDHRAHMAEAMAADDGTDAADLVAECAQALAERLETVIGPDAAMAAYRVATTPGRLTLREALEQWNAGAEVRDSTRGKRVQAVGELLGFLRLTDCLPDYVTEARAVAYVDWLNGGRLGHSTKQDRLSNLGVLWSFLERRRQVKRGSSPWGNHEVTRRSTGSIAAAPKEAKRGWKDSEIVALFEAPDGEDTRSAHYTRPLFRELYTLGLLTGMRLDEIVSLTPGYVQAIPGADGEGVSGYWLSIEASKTDAGVRTIPVVHPAAVAVLLRRLKRQPDTAASIFPECRPGGPDNKLSWHVQKALGRDRDRLGFGPEVDFHSTRRSFMSMMDNSGADVVHVQRYVGHRVPTLMHSVYSDGPSRESLLKVAREVRYAAAAVEAALAQQRS